MTCSCHQLAYSMLNIEAGEGDAAPPLDPPASRVPAGSARGGSAPLPPLPVR